MARSTTPMKKKLIVLALQQRLVSWAYIRASFISGALKPSFRETPLNESDRWQKKTLA